MTAQERKERPVYSGVLKYFPKALMEVARVSYAGNEQHNPGQSLRWDRSKSADEADACVRHLLQAGEIDTDGQRHTAKACWRLLALLQKELEAAAAKPAHDELYGLASPCAGGCGALTHPGPRCRKCRSKKLPKKS